jgi:predicted lactoylglutathione lyase
MNPRRVLRRHAVARRLYVNLPVRDVARSIAFFTRLGFAFDPQLTDERAACMPLAAGAGVMLLSRSRFADMTCKRITDPAEQIEAVLALTASSRAEVDDLVTRAAHAGGTPAAAHVDLGFMYGWGFDDLDGHTWEVIYMDPTALPPPDAAISG